MTWPSCRPSAGLLLLVALCARAAEPLPALQADTRELTASGLSSGGYMAVQMHVAYSGRVKGAAAIAAGPYYCAQGSLWTAYYNCMSPGTWTPLTNTQLLLQQTAAMHKAGAIDAPSNLAGARAWLFSGTQDRTVLPEVVRGLRDYYASYKADLALVADRPAGHAFVTAETGNACGATAQPYINNCGYDAAGELLRHLLGTLAVPGNGGKLQRFDQKPFVASGLHAEGWVYVPKSCEAGKCRVHVAFHGCRQTAEEFAKGAGYNRWADSNRLIVLYPQARESWWPWNPRGCWDWWGYTGAAYHTRDGVQVKAVMAMVARLSEARK